MFPFVVAFLAGGMLYKIRSQYRIVVPNKKEDVWGRVVNEPIAPDVVRSQGNLYFTSGDPDNLNNYINRTNWKPQNLRQTQQWVVDNTDNNKTLLKSGFYSTKFQRRQTFTSVDEGIPTLNMASGWYGRMLKNMRNSPHYPTYSDAY